MRTGYHIPFNRAAHFDTTFEYMHDAFDRGRISGGGHYTRLCQQVLEQELGAARVLLTTSCTHALEMSALLLDIQPGDEVILPSFTFVSTANAFALRGAKPVFADIDPATLNIAPDHVEALITPRTRALVPVHYAGVGCDMKRLGALAATHDIAVVEDNAHGLFGAYRGQMLGTFGAMATLSFHETKNFSCGEGGALIINDPAFAERAEIIWEKGTDRRRFFRGEVDKYTWVDLGSSYLPSDVLAAMLWAQLENRALIQQRRGDIWHTYETRLADWASVNAIQLPTVPDDRDQAYHLFYLLMPTLEARQALIAHLKAQGILSVFHYQPLHLSRMGRQFGGQVGDCPVTEAVSDRLVRLPLYYGLTDAQQAAVIEAVQSFAC
ncbi:MAG: dTDP-4-amino-4,6-dideoxygalactose transaminase [Anaerolineae bacterium]